jgi:hypothetical protein
MDCKNLDLVRKLGGEGELTNVLINTGDGSQGCSVVGDDRALVDCVNSTDEAKRT